MSGHRDMWEVRPRTAQPGAQRGTVTLVTDMSMRSQPFGRGREGHGVDHHTNVVAPIVDRIVRLYFDEGRAPSLIQNGTCRAPATVGSGFREECPDSSANSNAIDRLVTRRWFHLTSIRPAARSACRVGPGPGGRRCSGAGA